MRKLVGGILIGLVLGQATTLLAEFGWTDSQRLDAIVAEVRVVATEIHSLRDELRKYNTQLHTQRAE